MENTRQEMLDTLLKAYSHSYDIFRDESAGFSAAAEYHARDEKYVGFKSHVVYATEQNEYVYFYETEHLTAPLAQELIARSRETGLSRIHPHSEHMFSYVTLVIVADVVDPEAKRLIRRCHFRKNFRLSLHGWMEYHIAVMDRSSQEVISNPAGRAVSKLLRQNFRPRLK